MEAKAKLNVEYLEIDPALLQNSSNLLKQYIILEPNFLSELLYFCTYQNLK